MWPEVEEAEAEENMNIVYIFNGKFCTKIVVLYYLVVVLVVFFFFTLLFYFETE